MYIPTILTLLTGAYLARGAAATSPQFSAFTSNACSGNSLATTQRAQGAGTCFTLKSAAHSFNADTDGCSFSSFTDTACSKNQGLLEQGSCDTNLGAFSSVLQTCS